MMTRSLLLSTVAFLIGLSTQASAQTANPIKHLVVIFDENVSFDHYFGTYPNTTQKGNNRLVRSRHANPNTGRTKNRTAYSLWI